VPVVVLAGRPPILGFNAQVLTAAIGAAAPAEEASPAALWESLDRVLDAIIRAARRLPDADLDVRVPNRDRTLGELIHDVFYKAILWGGQDRADKDDAKQRADAARHRDAESLVRYAQAVRALLRACFAPESGADYGRVIDTPEGRMTVGGAVAWLAAHSAHHLRQIYRLMEDAGVRPADPLDPATLPGVRLPESLW
jgi:uncharacterized damage-inducible protein DinB